MQDNNYKELSNKGWGMMESILDKEMPVKKSNKRLFILLFLGLTLLGGLGFYYVENRTKISEISVVELIEESLEEESQEQIEFSKIAKPSSKPSSNTTNIEKGVAPLVSSKDKLEKQVLHIDENQSTLITSNQKVDLETSTKEKKKEVIQTKYLESAYIEKASTEKRESLTSIKNEFFLENKFENKPMKLSSLGQKRVKEHNIDLVDNMDVEPLLYTMDYDLQHPLLTIVSDRNPFYIRMYAGYSFPMLSKINGPEFGVNLGKEISRRWSLELGAHLLLSNKNASLLPRNQADFVNVSQDPDNEVFLEDFSGIATLNEAGFTRIDQRYYGLITKKLTKLYFLNIPLQLDYKISRLQQLGIGIQYHYLLTAKNDEINLSELEPTLSMNNSYLENSILLEQELLNRHNFSFKGQYRLLLTQKLGLTISGNVGVRKILKTDVNIDSRNRLSYMKLGVDYKL